MKYEYLMETKNKFKENLNWIGANITDSTTFRQYVDYLKSLYYRFDEITIMSHDGLGGKTSQNGTPAPTSPIAVENVTGRQDIEIRGKNLYDGVSTNKGANSAGVILVQNSHYLGFDDVVAVSPNTTYTVTFFDYELATTTIAEYKKDGTFIERRSLSLNRTFTTGADTYYVFCWMFNSNIDYTTGTRVQLELGEQSTNYEEYIGNTYEINLGTTELCKIGDYKDFIRKGTGKNLCNYQALNLVTNGNGTTSTVNGYYNVIIDTENMSSLYVSGNFALLNSSTLRVGGYNTYPAVGVNGTRYNITSNNSFSTGSHKYYV